MVITIHMGKRETQEKVPFFLLEKGNLRKYGLSLKAKQFLRVSFFPQSVRLISLSVCKQDRIPVHQAASFPRFRA